MAKIGAKCPEHKDNQKRSEAKARRGKGILAMEKAGMDHAAWTQKHDPLFKVKGKERHRRLHG